MVPFILLALVLFFYFAPAIMAYSRKTTNSAQVFVINLFLGWTLLGWVIALAMACSPNVLTKRG